MKITCFISHLNENLNRYHGDSLSYSRQNKTELVPHFRFQSNYRSLSARCLQLASLKTQNNALSTPIGFQLIKYGKNAFIR